MPSRVSVFFMVVCLLSLFCANTFGEEQEIRHRKKILSLDFNKEKDLYGVWAWSDAENRKPEVSRTNLPDGSALVSRGEDRHYNTPIFQINPQIKIGPDYVLEFMVKSPVGGLCELNLHNADENAEYRFHFPLEENTWVLFRRRLVESNFKRNFGDTAFNDGFSGDRLGRIQIATKGREVLIKYLHIYRTPDTFEPLPRMPKLLDSYTSRSYKQFERNGFFPYGAITTVSASNRANGRFFSQDYWERFEYDVRDLRAHNLNLVSNFCDIDAVTGKRQGERLELMQFYHFNIMETALANATMKGLDKRSPALWKSFKKYSDHPNIAAWYARDEPSDFKKYLENKLIIAENSPGKPVSSAFCTEESFRVLAPYMELTMPDVYPLTPRTSIKNAAQIFAQKSSRRILLGKTQSPVGRVWYIAQAFSNRRYETKLLLRYPEAVETRFDIYNALAAGAEGIIFFIHGDCVPYLDGHFRNEEFDQTMIDAWYNDNSTYEEVSNIGLKLVPLMPSLFGSKDLVPYEFDENRKISSRTFENELGRYRWVANGNLERPARVASGLKLKDGEKLYELLSMREDISTHERLTVRAGDGALFMASTPENFTLIKGEVNSRHLKRLHENAEIKLKLLKRAGFDTAALFARFEKIDRDCEADDLLGQEKAEKALQLLSADVKALIKSNGEYVTMTAALDKCRALFGKINAGLTKAEVIVKIDTTKDKDWQKFFASIKDYSKIYFDLLRECEYGDFSNLPETEKLAVKISSLMKNAPELP